MLPPIYVMCLCFFFLKQTEDFRRFRSFSIILTIVKGMLFFFMNNIDTYIIIIWAGICDISQKIRFTQPITKTHKTVLSSYLKTRQYYLLIKKKPDTNSLHTHLSNSNYINHVIGIIGYILRRYKYPKIAKFRESKQIIDC